MCVIFVLDWKLNYGCLVLLTDNSKASYFSTRHAWRIHGDSTTWLTKKLFDEPFDGKTVVVTHHGPSRSCEHKMFGHSDLSGAFYSDLPNLVERADIWICGHSHSNLNLTINSTRLISNQKGYPNEMVSDFQNDLIV